MWRLNQKKKNYGMYCHESSSILKAMDYFPYLVPIWNAVLPLRISSFTITATSTISSELDIPRLSMAGSWELSAPLSWQLSNSRHCRSMLRIISIHQFNLKCMLWPKLSTPEAGLDLTQHVVQSIGMPLHHPNKTSEYD